MKTSLSGEAKIVFFITAIPTIFILLTGIFTKISLGDEQYHYRYATYMLDTGKRPVYDPLVGTTSVSKRLYMVEPLWHFMLAGIWALTGMVSPLTAQVYQVAWYIFLVWFTYLLGKHLFDRELAAYSSLIMATMPMSAAFSVMLYTDIPIAALSTLALLVLFKKRYFWAGVLLGLMFLTKRNSYFFAPYFVFFILFFDQAEPREKIRNLIWFLLPLIIITLPDFIFRYQSLGSLTHPPSGPEPLYRDNNLQITFVHPGNLDKDPENLLRYLGIPFFSGTILFLLSLVRRRHQDNYLNHFGRIMFLIVFYVGLYTYCFWNTLAIRYLSPILPALSMISAVGFFRFFQTRKRLGMALIVVMGFLQLGAALTYVYKQRDLTPEYRLAYQHIKDHTLPQSRFLTPLGNLSLYTQRPSIWHTSASLLEIGYLFWRASHSEVLEILNRYNINYICVDKKRIFDDSKTDVKDVKNYPLSFVNKLYTFPFLGKTFENKEVILWKVMNDG